MKIDTHSEKEREKDAIKGVTPSLSLSFEFREILVFEAIKYRIWFGISPKIRIIFLLNVCIWTNFRFIFVRIEIIKYKRFFVFEKPRLVIVFSLSFIDKKNKHWFWWKQKRKKQKTKIVTTWNSLDKYNNDDVWCFNGKKSESVILIIRSESNIMISKWRRIFVWSNNR